MKKINVSDFTLRSLCESQNPPTFREMLSIAQHLEAMGADTVELPAILNEKQDCVICKTIAGALKNAVVAIPAGDTVEKLAAAWDCIKDTEKPCIQIILPVSTVQMEYTYHYKAPKMLLKIAELCKAASALCGNVELIAQDASRAEAGFVAQCCQTAQENGASAITVCDNSGVYFPEDFAALVKEIKEVSSLNVYVQPSNAINMAAACAVEAIKAGADGVKTSVCKEYLSAETLADIFRVKADTLDASSSLDITAIHNIAASIKCTSDCCSTSANDSVEVNSEQLDNSYTLADLSAYIKELGYELSDEDNGKVYNEFKRVIDKKSVINTSELEAIVASTAMQVPSTFHVSSFVVNSGNIITATAHITLEKNGESLSGVSTGDGPIDAAFQAIEQIIGHHYELDDFRINSTTKGREAVGTALIRLRADGRLYSGTGVSTDIIGACIRAYVNALNKIVYEEN